MAASPVTSALPAVALLLPVVGAMAAAPLSRVSERLRDAVLVALGVATAVVVATLVPGVLRGQAFEVYLLQMTPRIWMYLRVDPMGTLFAMTATLLWLLALVYSTRYMADEHRRSRYFAFFMLCLGWTVGVAFAGNLLTFLIFYELFSIFTYPLVVHEETPEAIAAGTKYIIYILIGGSLVLLAIVVTFFAAGSQTLDPHGFLTMGIGRSRLLAIFWCFVAGFGVKAALFPLHGWVPDAHPAAPAPFSAVLSGIMVAAGSFGILRVLFNVFGPGLLAELDVTRWLGYVAALTVLFGAVIAASQDDLKRRLAYSTISQMGYVVLGASLLGDQALTGALAHIANHAFMKGTLFLCAGVLIKQAGIRRISDMGGLAARFPITMAAFTVAALAMIGTPPLSGFISKWYLGLGMVEAGQPLYLLVLLGGALLAAVYLLPVVYTAYFKESGATPAVRANPHEAPVAMLGAVVAGAALTVLYGVASWLDGMPVSLARAAAELFMR